VSIADADLAAATDGGAAFPFARPARREAGDGAATRPVVQVTIGRVEVRAVPPPVPAASPEPVGPRVSLEEYLRERRGGRS
jgi:hypothetical protein